MPEEETTPYFGVKFNKRVTWNPHIKEMEWMGRGDGEGGGHDGFPS